MCFNINIRNQFLSSFSFFFWHFSDRSVTKQQESGADMRQRVTGQT